MVSAAERAPLLGSARFGFHQRIRAVLLRSEPLRGYFLLSPTLLVMLIMMVIPAVGMTALSFFSQDYFTIDFAPTLKNYRTIFELSATPTHFLGFQGTLFGIPYDFPGIPFYFENPIYLILLFKSILMSLSATIAVIVLAYPMAYFLAFRVTRHKLVWIILITVPFWTSYLLRVFAWKVILGFNGVINSGLIGLGVISEPLEFLLYNPTAVTITLAHAWAAFAILPIYVSLEKIDRSLLEAATDLGDGPVRRFFRVTLPLSAPGTIAASLLVFIPTVGDYVTPTLVGGTSGIMIGNVIQSLFGKANNAPLGAAVSIVSMLTITLLVCLFLWRTGRGRPKQQAA